jgi:hypothetical protein
MGAMMNYIIKSVVETTASGARVEKSTAERPATAIKMYQNHVERGLKPLIYKKNGVSWEEIKLTQLIEEQNSKIKGRRCAYKVIV